MRRSKFFGIVALALACIMLLTACGGNPTTGGGGSTVKPIKDGDICTGIVIKSMPKKLTYKEGEKFNPAGLVFDAVYQNGFDGDTGLIGADLDGFKPTGPLASDVKQIELIFEGISQKIDITVIPKTLLDVKVTREPDIRSYYAGDPLDLSGLVVKASYEEGDVDGALNYTVTDKDGKEYKHGDILENAVGDLDLNVSITSGEITKTDMFTVSVYRGMTLQAEDYVAADAEQPTDRSYTVIKNKSVDQVIKTDCTFTGTGYIGSIDKGMIIEFYLYCEEAIENADLVLIASSTCQGDGKMEDMQFNQFCKVTVGNEIIPIPDYIIIEGKEYPSASSGGNKWTNWADVPFGIVDLQAGFNKVVVECTGTIKDNSNNPRTPNIDRLDVRAIDADAVVTRGDCCTDMIVKTMPAKLEYNEGDIFDPAGIVFDAVYRNGYDGDINLGADSLRIVKPDGPLTANDKKARLTYKNFTKEIDITVNPKDAKSLAIEREPDVKAYSVGSVLSLSGLVVKATLDDGSTEIATGYTITDENGKIYTDGTVLDKTGDIVLTVTYRNKTASFTVKVSHGVTLQAEDALASGETAPTDRGYTVVTLGNANYNTSQGTGSTPDKKGCIENISQARNGKPSTKIEFYIYSEAAINGADLIFTMSSPNNRGGSTATKMDDMQFSKMFKVSVGEGADEKDLLVGDGVFVEGKQKQTGMSQWFMWTEVNVGKIDVKAGFTKVTLECIGQVQCGDGSSRAANIDSLTVRTGDTPDVRGKALQSVTVSREPYRTYYEPKAKFTLKGLQVQATYDGGITVDALNYVIKDASGKAYKEGDALGDEKRDLELFAEITDGTNVKKAPFTLHIGADADIRVEAEATLASGDTAPTDRSYTVITGKGSVKDGISHASGNKAVESMAVGSQIDFYIYSDKEVNGGTLVLNASSINRGTNRTKDSQFNKIFELYVDDVKIEIGDEVMLYGREANGNSIWFLFTDNELMSIDLKVGFTKVTLKVIGGVQDESESGTMLRNSNIDSLDIKF